MTEHERRERRVTALHESGHAVIGAVLGLPTQAVSIIATSRMAGYHKLAKPAGRFSERQLCVWSLAGAEAEKWFTNRDPRIVRQRAASDYAFVRDVLAATQHGNINTIAATYEMLAKALVISHEKWIEAVAARLLLDRVLSDDVVRDLEPPR